MNKFNVSNIPSIDTNAADSASKNQDYKAQFEGTLNSSKSQKVDDRKIAALPAILWLSSNSGWLIPSVMVALGATGTALNSNKIKQSLEDLVLGIQGAGSFTAQQASQVSRQILKNARDKNVPIEIRKRLEANLIPTKAELPDDNRSVTPTETEGVATPGAPLPDGDDEDDDVKQLRAEKKDLEAQLQALQDQLKVMLKKNGIPRFRKTNDPEVIKLRKNISDLSVKNTNKATQIHIRTRPKKPAKPKVDSREENVNRAKKVLKQGHTGGGILNRSL